MDKKLMLACMAITAFAAFVIAPAASASPVLTENGAAIAVGTSIEGENVGNAEFTGGGVTCSKAILGITVTKNNGTKIEAEVPVGKAALSGTNADKDCTSTLNKGAAKVEVNSKLCLSSGELDKIAITGCGNVVTMTVLFTGVVTCHYQVSTLLATFTTNATPDALTIKEEVLKGESTNSGFCPAEGKFSLTFDLWTTGTAIGLTIS
ncbi:MAG: hypothetical protein ACTHKT_00760 [Solirubrobacterales bacterium]